MSWDLGAVVPLSVSITDGTGNPANAGAVAVTVTLPDGTTSAPAASNPATGVYNADYPTVQAGRHSVRWVATGLNASAYTDTFDVAPADPYQIVSLAEAKAHLRKPATASDDDDDLMGFIRAATGVVEQYVGSVVRRTWVETFDGGGHSRLLLAHPPALSVTSVVEDGATLAAADYKLHPASGVLTRVAGSWDLPWRPGIQNVVVTYAAGRTAVEASWRLAALIIVKHMWETQRAAAPGPLTQGNEDFDPRYTYSIPRRALELLGEPVGGIA